MSPRSMSLTATSQFFTVSYARVTTPKEPDASVRTCTHGTHLSNLACKPARSAPGGLGWEPTSWYRELLAEVSFKASDISGPGPGLEPCCSTTPAGSRITAAQVSGRASLQLGRDSEPARPRPADWSAEWAPLVGDLACTVRPLHCRDCHPAAVTTSRRSRLDSTAAYLRQLSDVLTWIWPRPNPICCLSS